ncbi:protein YELLOW LEAF 1, choloroplastic-like [Raphanus sativus]|uniref:Protein YELLOW LEAF 1, choloroplastic-like n=1 Tax=Raphanus sativus TaxID=3726 RepID=A0A6J0KUM3_RAPSA|nr:protein YELLOW LEAF 1, choloroplastic-like [Raphanus sativus]
MAVMNHPSLRIGAPPSSVFLPPPRFNHLPAYGLSLCFGIYASSYVVGQFRGRRCYYNPTRVSMQSKNQIIYPSLKAVGTGGKGFGFDSKSKKTSRFACNAALTLTRESPTITRIPTHGIEKSPKLDDGGRGFPPRNDGGGGGGGGGGESFFGGFFLFGFLMFMAHLKDLEGEHDNNNNH